MQLPPPHSNLLSHQESSIDAAHTPWCQERLACHVSQHTGAESAATNRQADSAAQAVAINQYNTLMQAASLEQVSKTLSVGVAHLHMTKATMYLVPFPVGTEAMHAVMLSL